MVDTPRTDYWQNVTLTPTGVSAGTYYFGNGTVEIDTDGRILSASSANLSVIPAVVADMVALANLASESDEARFVVVEDTGNGYRGLFYYNGSTFVRIGNDPVNSVRYTKASITTAASNSIGAPIPSNAVVRTVRLNVRTPYTAGTLIEIRGNGGTTLMETSHNDPEVPAIYEYEMDTIAAIGSANTQIQAIITNSPSTGSAEVVVEYRLP